MVLQFSCQLIKTTFLQILIPNQLIKQVSDFYKQNIFCSEQRIMSKELLVMEVISLQYMQVDNMLKYNYLHTLLYYKLSEIFKPINQKQQEGKCPTISVFNKMNQTLVSFKGDYSWATYRNKADNMQNKYFGWVTSQAICQNCKQLRIIYDEGMTSQIHNIKKRASEQHRQIMNLHIECLTQMVKMFNGSRNHLKCKQQEPKKQIQTIVIDE